jgi:hypothetical protein
MVVSRTQSRKLGGSRVGRRTSLFRRADADHYASFDLTHTLRFVVDIVCRLYPVISDLEGLASLHGYHQCIILWDSMNIVDRSLCLR